MTTQYDILPWESSDVDNLHQVRQFIEAIQQTLIDAEGIQVNNDESFREATSIYKKVKEAHKKIDEWRLEATVPLRQKTAAINDRAKEFTTPLEKVESIINLKIDGYRRLIDRQKKDEADELRKAKELFEIDEPIFLPDSPKSLRSDGVSAFKRKIKSFRIVDQSLIPAEFMMVNEKAIENAIKDGRHLIPGIEIYEETKTQLRIN